MYKGKKFLAVIPARGGSKGIPHKNITVVNGKELIVYTLDTAKKSKYLDRIIVSTEDQDIANVAVREGVEVLERPLKLAEDYSKTIDVILHVIKNLHDKYDYLVLLQPTQPLRLSVHIDEAIEKMVEEKYTSLVSVSPCKNHPILMRKMNRKRQLSKLLRKESTVRRQDFDKYYVVNGAIYINKVEDLNQSISLNDNEYGYEMESQYDLDIDEPEDLELLKYILNKRLN